MDVFEVPRVDDSYILASVFRNTGVVVGAPTYEGKLFPPMAHTLDSILRKRMINRKAFRYGSFGWSGGAQREFDQLAEALKWEQSPAFEFNGAPTLEDLERAEELGAEFARLVRDTV
jgi:flavorubredoxin